MKQIFLLCAFLSFVLQPTTARCEAVVPGENPDVPRTHWAYEAYDLLVANGLFAPRVQPCFPSALPSENTRYEFAVGIARSLQGAPRDSAFESVARNRLTRAEINDLINALRREFVVELANMGVRDFPKLGNDLEGRVQKPARLTVSKDFLHRLGSATFIPSDVERYLEKTPSDPPE